MVRLQSLLLVVYCMVSCINAGANRERNGSRVHNTLFRPETSANFTLNVGDEQDSILISTFFDLFWYIIGLLVFCICCISCLLLFYLQQTKKHDSNIKSQTSISQSLQYCESRSPQTNISTATTASRQMSNKSALSTTKSLTATSKTSKPSANTVNKHTPFSLSAVSAFSAVDSEGVDMRIDNINISANMINIFETLGPVADEFESSQSSKTFNEPPQPKPYDVMSNTDCIIQSETLDDDTDVELDYNDSNYCRDRHHTQTSESSIDSNGGSIIAMMKKRSNMAYNKAITFIPTQSSDCN